MPFNGLGSICGWLADVLFCTESEMLFILEIFKFQTHRHKAITGAKQQSIKAPLCFYLFFLFYLLFILLKLSLLSLFILPWKSMAARRTVWAKAVKYGTLVEGHTKRLMANLENCRGRSFAEKGGHFLWNLAEWQRVMPLGNQLVEWVG